MVEIKTLAEPFDLTLLSSARDLFREYAGFLRTIQACHGFDFKRFEQEIFDLPRPYTNANGELLVALADSKPAGCIAFRSLPVAATALTADPPAAVSPAPASTPDPFTPEPSSACEIKRLFVLPSHRSQGIAESLVLTALDHARARGFRTAILDTEPSTMRAANLLYRKLGFTGFSAQPTSPSQGTVFLRKDLV